MVNEMLELPRKNGKFQKLVDRVIEFSVLHYKAVDFYEVPSDELFQMFNQRIEQLGLKHEWQFEHCDLSDQERYGMSYRATTLRVWK